MGSEMCIRDRHIHFVFVQIILVHESFPAFVTVPLLVLFRRVSPLLMSVEASGVGANHAADFTLRLFRMTVLFVCIQRV